MRKWAYRVDDKYGEFRITNCSLKDLKPALRNMKKLALKDSMFNKVIMSRPLYTLLIENVLLNTYKLQEVATITIQTNEA